MKVIAAVYLWKIANGFGNQTGINNNVYILKYSHK